MGWEKSLIPRCRRLFEAYAKGFPKSLEVPRAPVLVWWPTPGKQGSGNHKAMAWTSEALRAAAWGSRAQLEPAMEGVFHWLSIELDEIGLWTREQTCPIPHGGMHLNAAVAARILARHTGHPELTARVNEHWARLGSVLAAGATPGGAIWLPGERCPGRPIHDQASACWRIINHLPQRAALRHGLDGLSEKDRNVFAAAIGVEALRLRGDQFRGVDTALEERGALPLLRRRMVVDRWHGGHLAYLIDADGDVGEVCDWVLVDHDEQDTTRQWKTRGYTYSKGFKNPPPGVPDGVTLGRRYESPPRRAA